MHPLSDRFEQAISYAFQLHRRQSRKGSRTPYFAHLMAVAALVLEDGGDEDQAIAALLHDAPEDQGGLAVLYEIQARFGERVATIVDGCTDTYESPKPPWRQRKERYIQHLQRASQEVLRVSLADKLHNARTTLVDLKKLGPPVWSRFNGGMAGTLWYYQALVKVFQQCSASPMVAELENVVAELEKLAGRQTSKFDSPNEQLGRSV